MMPQVYDVSTDLFREMTQADADELARLRHAFGVLVVGLIKLMEDCKAIASGEDNAA